MLSLNYLKPSSEHFARFLIVALVAVPIFGYGIYKVWGAVTAQKTLTSANSISGLVAHYTLDGKNTSSTNVRNGLAGYWKLNEGVGITAADSSGNNNTGTLTNGPTWTAGQLDNAVSFDGIDDAVNIGPSIDLSGTNVVTVSFWMKWNSFANDDDLAMEFSTNLNENNGVFAMDPNSSAPALGSFAVTLRNGGLYNCAYFTRPSAGEWHHYVFVMDMGQGSALGEHTHYVDGVSQSLSACPGASADLSGNFGNFPLYFMSRAGSSLFGAGSLDDVRVYNRALSAAEITQLYNYAGSTVFDTSGNGYNATSTDDNIITGKIGQALSFNGASDVVSAGNIGNVNSISFWINTSSTTQKIINLNATTYVEIASGTITATGFTSPTIYIDDVVTSTLTSGWHHVAITTGSAITASTMELGRVGTNYMSGSLDDVRFYSRAISASEVTRLYQLGGTTKINKTLERPGETIESGLVGSWSFNGADVSGTTAYDRSGSANNGTLTNGPTATIGKVGQALSFDGTNDEMTTATNQGNGSNVKIFTLSAWFKTSSASGKKIIGLESNQTGTGSSAYDREIYIGTDGKVYFRIWDGANKTAVSSATFTDNNWHHAVAVSTGDSGSITLYVDGVLQQTTVIGSIYASYSTSYWRIGGYIVGAPNGASGYFPGSIDEVRIYNRALSADEITRLYLLGGTTKINKTLERPGDTIESGLIGHWTMDGKYLTPNVRDRSTSANHGNLTGQAATTTIIGKVGQALSFDGTDDYITTNQNVGVSGKTASVSLWFKTPAVSSYSTRVMFELSPDFNASDAFVVSYNDNSGGAQPTMGGILAAMHSAAGYSLYSTNSRYDDNNWHHLGVIFDRNQAASVDQTSIYIDGIEVNTSVIGSNNAVHTTSFTDDKVYINARYGSIFPFQGSTDDVRIYNRALSAAEVLRLYQMGK